MRDKTGEMSTVARVSGGCWTVCEAQRRVSETHPKGRGFVSKGETWGAKPEGGV